ncbi:putative chaperone protein EcpD [Klebsiella oxytoca]|uniref:Fimbrial chaperone n=1 Tax=Klebsiella oxytoca TaxID=571 RepID=A0AAD3UII4_KLEOX|nr:fimbrial chaperone [Klebsiella oxytoca]EJY1760487.1 fimbrial chaperone [Klebsiella oxytoca]EKH6433605.1 fimbrial chaperone [Klebsiella oxytoca]EKJ7586068.1 fimbrial chaperone [Klebsiella oxytoca]ELT9683546.1 fimbrial chaperone [Klebsiella oxytoca]ELT9977164.1 fimbrial chaperone [Klebsiella oxytoca]
MHRFTQLTLTSLVCASAAFSTFNACADIVISGTRVIYPQSSKDVTVKMENRGTKPLLVQSWLDDGRDTVNPQELKLPFIVTPPVSRIDPSKGQTVRITWTQQPLAQDRESLFWFNVLEVPPKAKDGDSQNVLQLAFRTRIKMFFRPNGLPGDPAIAAGNLKWSQQGTALIANNSSPYYVSMAKATITVNGKKIEVDSHTIPPLSNETIPVKNAPALRGGKIEYTAINDFGGTEKHQAAIN